MYYETFIPYRNPKRKFFEGFNRTWQNAKWWSKGGFDSYISCYGYKKLIRDGRSRGFERDLLPDYTSAKIDKVLLDIDFIDPAGNFRDVSIDARKIDRWASKNDYRRRWTFTGGGYHCLISARGSTSNVESSHYYLANKLGVRIDNGASHTAIFRRVPGSRNTKRKCYVIPIAKEDLVLKYGDLIQMAQSPRKPGTKFTVGKETWFIESIEVSNCKREFKKKYSRKVNVKEKNKILEDYGLDWEIDFCPAIKHLITKEAPGNLDRLIIIRYLKSVLHVPFVSVLDENKTVMNLLYNILDNKNKAMHSIKSKESECIYKRDRKFHPYKLRMQGLCPHGCNKCLEKRT